MCESFTYHFESVTGTSTVLVCGAGGTVCVSGSVGYWGCHTLYQIMFIMGAAERETHTHTLTLTHTDTDVGQRGRAWCT